VAEKKSVNIAVNGGRDDYNSHRKREPEGERGKKSRRTKVRRGPPHEAQKSQQLQENVGEHRKRAARQ